MGQISGIVQLLKLECPAPWLFVTHCLNHRLELGAKDAFKETPIEIVTEMLKTLHQLYNNSPKQWRELQAVGEIMVEQIRLQVNAQTIILGNPNYSKKDSVVNLIILIAKQYIYIYI